MVDATTASSISQVQSSYSDVNTALENLIGNMSGGSSYDAKSAIENLQNQLNNFVGTNPVGTVLAFTTNSVPNGYLLCNGAGFDTGKYSQLYSALGTASVPDMRGLFLRGLDTSGNVDNAVGRSILSFEEGSPSFSSNGTDIGIDPWYNGSDNITFPQFLQQYFLDLNSPSTANQTFSVNYKSGSGGGSTSLVAAQSLTARASYGIVRPKNIAVNYIIKAVP